jgi:hypothetical protein
MVSRLRANQLWRAFKGNNLDHSSFAFCKDSGGLLIDQARGGVGRGSFTARRSIERRMLLRDERP